MIAVSRSSLMDKTNHIHCLVRASMWLHTQRMSCSPGTISVVCLWMKLLASNPSTCPKGKGGWMWTEMVKAHIG